MKRDIIITNDGSATIAIPTMGVTYHSTAGAIGESQHVFIDAGLQHVAANQPGQSITIFEMGFGTGLNALLSWRYALANRLAIDYTAVELFPISLEESQALHYGEALEMASGFEALYQCAWERPNELQNGFTITKINQSLIDFSTNKQFDLIYYDAFAPNDQPELWTTAIFEQLYAMLLPNGVLVTYCSKGDVRRTMMAVGFTVERLKGYANKWHMLRAVKL